MGVCTDGQTAVAREEVQPAGKPAHAHAPGVSVSRSVALLATGRLRLSVSGDDLRAAGRHSGTETGGGVRLTARFDIVTISLCVTGS